MRVNLEKVISGGQTGADRAALDAALEADIPVGGCCPEGRKAEDGTIPAIYPLVELASDKYITRTEMNVTASDATLVLNIGTLAGGTSQTIHFAQQHGKPFLVVQLDEEFNAHTILNWLLDNEVRVLNIAGPRESKRPGIYDAALMLLRQLFSVL
jgi:predicted Rossmann fold nucleotide-binding protein DprA/Smf involved in DNA uptake